MKFNLHPSLSTILAGTAIGAVGSVLLSLTLEPEISEIRMGQYGAFIGLIASATSVAMITDNIGNKDQSKGDSNPNKIDSKTDFNPILAEIVQKATENHLNALRPGSSEYFEALELYGKMLSGENTTPPTNSKKPKSSHHAQRA